MATACRFRSIAVQGVDFEMVPGDVGTDAERASSGAVIPRWRTVPDKRKPDQRQSMRTLCCLNLGTPQGLVAHSAEPCWTNAVTLGVGRVVRNRGKLAGYRWSARYVH